MTIIKCPICNEEIGIESINEKNIRCPSCNNTIQDVSDLPEFKVPPKQEKKKNLDSIWVALIIVFGLYFILNNLTITVTPVLVDNPNQTSKIAEKPSSKDIIISQKVNLPMKNGINHLAIEIKNNSDKNIEINNVIISVLDRDGYVLATTEYFHTINEHIRPDQVTYVGGELILGDKQTDVESIDVRVKSSFYDGEIRKELLISQIKTLEKDFWGLYCSGFIKNNLQKETDAHIMFVFFDENDNVLFLVKGSIENLDIAENRPFTTDILNTPEEKIQMIDYYKAIAVPKLYTHIF